MPDGRLDDVVAAQVAGDRLRLGRRLDDDQLVTPLFLPRRTAPRRGALASPTSDGNASVNAMPCLRVATVTPDGSDSRRASRKPSATRSRTAATRSSRSSAAVPIEQGRERVQDLADGQVAVTGADERGLDGVDLAGAAHPALLAQHDRLGVGLHPARPPSPAARRPRRVKAAAARSGRRPRRRRSCAAPRSATSAAERLLHLVGPLLEVQHGVPARCVPQVRPSRSRPPRCPARRTTTSHAS